MNGPRLNRPTLGDYCSGTNHVLPTNGAARAYSGVSVASFQNSISVQSVSRDGLGAIGPCAITLARAHGQSPNIAAVVGYIGKNDEVARAVTDWSLAYADVSEQDYRDFLNAG